jgi:hypothetical protein
VLVFSKIIQILRAELLSGKAKRTVGLKQCLSEITGGLSL